MDQADVVIVTALAEEFEAAKEAGLAAADRPGIGEWRSVSGDAPHLVGEYRTPDGHTFSVALGRPTRMGGRSTAPIATKLVGLLRPTCLAMSGACAGNPDDLAPGDVVVADLVYEYDEGKLVGDAFECLIRRGTQAIVAGRRMCRSGSAAEDPPSRSRRSAQRRRLHTDR